MALGIGNRKFTLLWKRYTAYAYQPSRWSAIGVVVLVVAGCVVSIALSLPLIAFAFATLVLLPVAMLAPLRTKVIAQQRGVEVHRQPFYSNPVILIALMSGLISAAMIIAIAIGYWQAWRLVIPAFGGLVLVPLLSVVSFKERGPLLLSADGVVFGNGDRYQFDSSAIAFTVLSNGVPAIEFTHSAAGYSTRPRRLVHRPYNVDFNSLLSTLEQLQKWHHQRRPASPAEIKGMLTVTPPDDVEVGESVQIEALVEDDLAHR
ncbi:hypothetical protein [Gordonia hankookensis]|uniref:Uncharacterized protein n=1 Tax=Gordonia hankookensis TaxID=589403 RepID=A0ABR7WDD0_9ACTN|nr:hypothetical protein [Gordonia hankookensis]MBD1320551.1 hypothetical protein [Gordonia hankookensis]